MARASTVSQVLSGNKNDIGVFSFVCKTLTTKLNSIAHPVVSLMDWGLPSEILWMSEMFPSILTHYKHYKLTDEGRRMLLGYTPWFRVSAMLTLPLNSTPSNIRAIVQLGFEELENGKTAERKKFEEEFRRHFGCGFDLTGCRVPPRNRNDSPRYCR